MEEDDLDLLWCEVSQPKAKPILLGSMYRSPNSDADHQSRIKANIDRAVLESHETLILGDINHDLACPRKSQDALNKDFQQFMRSMSMKQLINSHTRVTERSKSTIDHIYVNRSINILANGVISSGLTDHRLV